MFNESKIVIYIIEIMLNLNWKVAFKRLQVSRHKIPIIISIAHYNNSQTLPHYNNSQTLPHYNNSQTLPHYNISQTLPHYNISQTNQILVASTGLKLSFWYYILRQKQCSNINMAVSDHCCNEAVSDWCCNEAVSDWNTITPTFFTCYNPI
jgi:hypothetical protein